MMPPASAAESTPAGTERSAATEARPADQPTAAGAGSSPTCGACGRECLPDGDCYGCEADRWIARAAGLEAGCATWRAQAEALAAALEDSMGFLEALKGTEWDQEGAASSQLADDVAALARLPAGALAERRGLEAQAAQAEALAGALPSLLPLNGRSACVYCDLGHTPDEDGLHFDADNVWGGDQACLTSPRYAAARAALARSPAQTLAERRAMAKCETVTRLAYLLLGDTAQGQAHDIWITAQQWGLYTDDVGESERMLGILAEHALAALDVARREGGA